MRGFACLCSTCKQTAELIEHAVAMATEMFAAGAFLHQYDMYGLHRPAFVDAFATLEQVLKGYQEL
jgi:hypothetical protein